MASAAYYTQLKHDFSHFFVLLLIEFMRNTEFYANSFFSSRITFIMRGSE